MKPPRRGRVLLDAFAAKRGGEKALTSRQQSRFTQLVTHAREHSPYYRRLYREAGVADDVNRPAQLPVVDKARLMSSFDEWVTDPTVTLAKAHEFTADPDRVGESFAGRYTLTTTSGTTGRHGIFVQDASATAVTGAMTARVMATWIGLRGAGRIARRGARMALVVPAGGHFASTVAAARLRDRSRVLVLDVRRPLRELVEELNAFQPTVLTPYASLGLMLAGEAEAGRLRIDPQLVVLSAEGLSIPDYERVATAFDATVRTSWAANECPFLSYSCAEHWLHVNADWVAVEPVDERYRPVPPGTVSHTVLVTNLANRIQPILRYDLGDAIEVRPDPCGCGAPGPAVRVRGRTADLLTFTRPDREPVSLSPLAVATLLESVPGLESFQLVQTAPAALSVRTRPTATTAEPLWRDVATRLRELLDDHDLGTVRVEPATEPPQPGVGGKIRPVIPLPQATE